jgi:hypothetical protein
LKKRLGLILLLISIMLGCSHTYRLYPVQGPISQQTPSLVLFAKVTGQKSGSISVVLGDGEVCNGNWALMPAVQVPKDAIATNAPPTNSMAAEWDAVYGPGFYLSHIVGAKYYSQAVVSGNRGTVLNFEMLGMGVDKGIAKDNKGNVYKMVW